MSESNPLAPSAPVHEVSYEEILARLEDPRLTIVNVLPQPAWEEARIPGSMSLPLADIPERARRILPDLDREIAVYCGSPT
jgi:rhodanese-related sulfurtransferase